MPLEKGFLSNHTTMSLDERYAYKDDPRLRQRNFYIMSDSLKIEYIENYVHKKKRKDKFSSVAMNGIPANILSSFL